MSDGSKDRVDPVSGVKRTGFPVPGRDDLRLVDWRYGQPSPERVVSIYVISESPDGPVKIGVGAKPEKRLGECQIGNPRPLALYWQYPWAAAPLLERAAHHKLAESHLHGEWFDVSVADAVATIDLLLHTADHFGPAAIVTFPSVRARGDITEHRCSACRQWLPVAAFHESSIHATGLQSRCIDCAKSETRARMARDPEARAARNENARLAQNQRRGAARGGREAKPFRFSPGGPNPRAKLSPEARAEIGCRRANGERAVALAVEFDVTAGYVRNLGNAAKSEGTSPRKITEGRLGADVR